MSNYKTLEAQISKVENKITMKDQATVTIVSIGAVTWIYSLVLLLGLDGALLLPIVSIIAGISGYTVNEYKGQIKRVLTPCKD